MNKCIDRIYIHLRLWALDSRDGCVWGLGFRVERYVNVLIRTF